MKDNWVERPLQIMQLEKTLQVTIDFEPIADEKEFKGALDELQAYIMEVTHGISSINDIKLSPAERAFSARCAIETLLALAYRLERKK